MEEVVGTKSARRSRRRFLTLDALRGVGAIFVMAGHSGIALGGYTPTFYPLSVDMFFLLSGFVIAYAYDDRLAAGLDVVGFMRSRAQRLYPVYLIGLALGLGATILVNAHGLSRGQIATSFGCGLFNLPSPPMGTLGALYPMNGPFWSLFFEFWVANLTYAVCWRRLQGRALWIFVLVSGLGLLLAQHGFRTIDVGWTWRTFFGGVARVSFSFFAGVGLSRMHAVHAPKLQIPSWACLLAFVAVMLPPLHGRLADVYELAVVFAFFPALIYFGAEAVERHPRAGRALGDISYAAYAIHRPLLTVLAWLVLKVAGSATHFSAAFCLQAAFIAGTSALAWILNTKAKWPAAAKRRPVAAQPF